MRTADLAAPGFLFRTPWTRLATNRAGEDTSEPDARRSEEAEWIRRARNGEADAYRRLVDRYGGQAFETALRIVRSREEAEEVAQDAFVRAWKALDGFREESRFSTWLYRIVTRRALDVARTSQRRREHEVGLDPVVAETAASVSPDVDRILETRPLERLLGRLSPTARAVVTLHYLRERSVAEIVDILDLPAGTVKTHLHRSRAELRKAWKRQATLEDRP